MNKKISRSSIIFLTLAVLLPVSLSGLTGCRLVQLRQRRVSEVIPPMPQYKTPANVMVSQYYDHLRPRRVVIVTPLSSNHMLPEQAIFAREFATSLRHVGYADAVVSRPSACDTQAIRKGKFDMQQLVDLSSEYSADAILYCDVVSFSSYAPLEVSVSMTLVDARESIAILAMDGNWDLRDIQVQNSYLNHIGSSLGEDGFRAGIKFQSPTEFLNFAALDAAKFISEQ